MTSQHASVARPRQWSRLAPLLAVAALASAPPATRASDLPFAAAYATVFTSNVTFDPSPTAHIKVAGLGVALHLGISTAVTTDQTVDLITGAATATYRLTALNGDSLVLALEFQSTFVDPQTVTFEGAYTVIGGTGRFAGYTGQGTLRGAAHFLTDTAGIGWFEVAGTISDKNVEKKIVGKKKK